MSSKSLKEKKSKFFSLKSKVLAAFIVVAMGMSANAQHFDGSGTSASPYLIKTAADLAKMAEVVNDGDVIYTAAHYRLENNLDLSAYGASFNDGKGWIPIGTINSGIPINPFRGVFNGNGKVITGLYINIPGLTGTYAGLFGCVINGTIENLGLENINVTAEWTVGGIAAFLAGSAINKCYTTGSVVGLLNGYAIAGGIAGTVHTGETSYVGISSVTNCYSTASVSGVYTIGGIAGQVYADCSISNCYSLGTISASDFAGGIAGNVRNATGCAARNPSVKGTGIYVGRITGSIGSESSNNIAFDDMLNHDNNSTWNNIGEDDLDGADISIAEIYADGTLGGRFTAANGWTVADGKLPGLFGKTVDMPAHLSLVPVAPSITTTALPNAKVGTSYSHPLAATGTRPITWEIHSGALPNGLSLSAGGIVAGTPTEEGTFNFTVKASNSMGEDTKALSIVIAEAPVITSTVLPKAVIGQEYNYTLSATGTEVIIWSMEGGNSIAGIFFYTPGILRGTPNAVGTFEFTVKATNSAGEDSKTLSITIEATATPPAITTTSLPNGTINTAYQQQLDATGTMATWTVHSGALPAGLTLESSGLITGTPLVVGQFDFTVKAENAAGNDTKDLSITVNDGVGIGQLTIDNGQWTIYPNPTKGQLTIDNGQWTIEKVEVYDVVGRLMMQAPLNHPEGGRLPSEGGAGGGSITIDISHLPNGMYFLKVGNEMVKIIKG